MSDELGVISCNSYLITPNSYLKRAAPGFRITSGSRGLFYSALIFKFQVVHGDDVAVADAHLLQLVE